MKFLTARFDTLTDLDSGGELPSAAGAVKMARVFANAIDTIITATVAVDKNTRTSSPQLDLPDNNTVVFDMLGRKVGEYRGKGAAKMANKQNTGVYLYVSKQGAIKRRLGMK